MSDCSLHRRVTCLRIALWETQVLFPSFHETAVLKKGAGTEINLGELDRPVCSAVCNCDRFVCKALKTPMNKES